MIFISYAHEDVDFLDRLTVHLKSLESIFDDFALEIWEDRKIIPGKTWKKEIEEAISKSTVAILIVSADFLASEFITNEEIPKLLAREKKKDTKIIPVIVGPCGYSDHPVLSQLQSLNHPADWLGRMEKFQQEEYWDKLRIAVCEHLSENAEEE